MQMDEMLDQYDRVGKAREIKEVIMDSWQNSTLVCADDSWDRLKRFGMNLLKGLLVLCIFWLGEAVAGYIAAPLMEQSSLPLLVKIIIVTKEVPRIGRSVFGELLF